jgi:hypothetical protein
VHEDDVVTSSMTVERAEDLRDGLVAMTLRVTSSVGDTEVLSWRPVMVVR